MKYTFLFLFLMGAFFATAQNTVSYYEWDITDSGNDTLAQSTVDTTVLNFIFHNKWEGELYFHFTQRSGTTGGSVYIDEQVTFKDGTSYWIPRDTLTMATGIVKLNDLDVNGQKLRVRVATNSTAQSTIFKAWAWLRRTNL